MPEERNGKSYFFRSHKECWESLSDHEKWLIESSLIDEVCELDK
jgi:guanylate kinase